MNTLGESAFGVRTPELKVLSELSREYFLGIHNLPDRTVRIASEDK